MEKFEFKGTPGPWLSAYEPYTNELFIWSGCIRDENKVFRVLRNGTMGNQVMNASLISAAPDMFEALKEALAFATGKMLPTKHPIILKMISALQKATGQNEENIESGSGDSSE